MKPVDRFEYENGGHGPSKFYKFPTGSLVRFSDFSELALENENLRAELAALRDLCGAAYQAVGAADGPVEMLDNLSDAASGHPLRHAPGAGLPWVPASLAAPVAAPAVPAEVASAVQVLRKHNEWRRGADNNHWQATPYSPAELGHAIDAVCDHVSHSAQPDVLKRATEYAHDIVTWLHRDHYADNTRFEPFGDLIGLLSQIDNMICGWKEPAAPAVPDGVARDGLVIHTPLPVFSDGPWIFSETGQSFTGDELNVEAFCRYRNALLAAPAPYGFGHLPQVATEDMQDNMRTALIDQGWTSESAGEVDFQDIWDAAVVQFVESAEDAYAALLAAAKGEKP